MNVAPELAEAVADGLGIREMPAPMPKALHATVKPEVTTSPALSLFARPGDGSIRARRVAILVADGCDGAPLVALAQSADGGGRRAAVRVLTLGPVKPASGDPIEVDVSLEAAPSVLYDAVVLPTAPTPCGSCAADGRTLEFIKDQYRHCKPILALGDGGSCWKPAAFRGALPTGEPDSGLIVAPRDRRSSSRRLRRRHRQASAFRPGNRSTPRVTGHASVSRTQRRRNDHG